DLVKKGGDDEDEEERRERNRRLLEQAFPHLPKRVQVYLTKLFQQMQQPSSGGELVPVRGGASVNMLLGMDTSVIMNILLGLRFVPESQPLPMEREAMGSFFYTLATAKYTSTSTITDKGLPMLEGPEGVSIPVNEQRGVEHIYNSCYIASILHIIAAVPYYRRMFNPAENVLPLHSAGRRLQLLIHPLVGRLSRNGDVRAG